MLTKVNNNGRIMVHLIRIDNYRMIYLTGRSEEWLLGVVELASEHLLKPTGVVELASEHLLKPTNSISDLKK